MFKISYDKKITMVQGDTGVIRMRIHNYELSQGDEVRFAIVNKANPSILLCQHSDKKIVLEKQVTVFEKDGSARIVIYPDDTEYLQPGKYLYEIQVKTKDGRVDTVVPLTSFTLMDGSIQGEYGQTTPSKPEPTPSEIELRFKRLENEVIPELGTRVTNVENEIDGINSSLDQNTSDINFLKETVVNLENRLNTETYDDERLKRALNRAIAKGSRIIDLCEQTLTLQNSINLFEGCTLINGKINSDLQDYVFKYVTSNGAFERKGLKFINLEFNCDYAIKLNDVNNGFTDNAEGQNYIMRPLVIDCTFKAKNIGSGNAINFNKCFNSFIHRCTFNYYDKQIVFNGCDIGEINNNRFWKANTSHIEINSIGSFGSQTTIRKNDFLNLIGNNTQGDFIKSTDRSLRIQDNYFEQLNYTIVGKSVINLISGLNAIIENNRIEVKASTIPNWLIINSDFQLLSIKNNTTTGEVYGDCLFSGGAKYWYSNMYRQKIIHSGNTNSNGIPFNTLENAELWLSNPKIAFYSSPNVKGLAVGETYGKSIRIVDNMFVFPPLSNYGSMVRFDTPTNTTGNVNVYIRVRSDVNNTVLSYQRLNDSSVVDTKTITCPTSTSLIKIFDNVNVTNLKLKFWNSDTTLNGNIFIERIIVEYV